jgi:hypothetical protein
VPNPVGGFGTVFVDTSSGYSAHGGSARRSRALRRLRARLSAPRGHHRWGCFGDAQGRGVDDGDRVAQAVGGVEFVVLGGDGDAPAAFAGRMLFTTLRVVLSITVTPLPAPGLVITGTSACV